MERSSPLVLRRVPINISASITTLTWLCRLPSWNDLTSSRASRLQSLWILLYFFVLLLTRSRSGQPQAPFAIFSSRLASFIWWDFFFLAPCLRLNTSIQLHRAKNPLMRNSTNFILSKLIQYTVETGVLTSVFAITELTLWLASRGESCIYFPCYITLGRL